MESSVIPLFGLLMATVLGTNGAIWWKLGRVEAAAKHACPFGKCPMYERAKAEAAPMRDHTPIDGNIIGGEYERVPGPD